MTLQQVLDFLSIAEHGSLHGAARASGQTQPALSRSLRRLEADLGAPLFERHAGGMRPTVFGQRFAQHARRMAREATQARDAVRQMCGATDGQVSFGMSFAPSALLAPKAIARFRRHHAKVRLTCHNGLLHALAPLLRDAAMDFAICPLPGGKAPPGLVAQPMMTSQMVLMARREHPLARVRSVKALQQASFVTSGPAGAPGAGIVEAFERAGLEAPRIDLQSFSMIDTLAMVAGSDVIAMLPAALLKVGWLRDLLVRLPIEEPLQRYNVGLLTLRDHALTPAAQALAREFQREAAYLGLKSDASA